MQSLQKKEILPDQVPQSRNTEGYKHNQCHFWEVLALWYLLFEMSQAWSLDTNREDLAVSPLDQCCTWYSLKET